MNKILHILNGEATLEIFKQTAIEGDTLTWNEVLAQGPVAEQNFWKTRQDYICETYHVAPTDYDQQVLKEIEKLNRLNQYKDVVLWFEFDVVCQINLICVLDLISRKLHPDLKIELICPDKFEGIEDFRGLGQLNAAQLSSLYPTRELLNKNDLKVASQVWHAFTKQDIKFLSALDTNGSDHLHLLKPALKAYTGLYLKKDGFNLIETFFLNLKQKGITDQTEMIHLFWKKYPIYGFTDLYLAEIIDNLPE
ncbi:DUF1835 domain-containing protein [Pedobacter montanisoli]|uniref:DUF1835 domain-containing protein n=1 Tax=Pedobacter montanisoli TaxID=2923277 RepID=A0ABS9ZTG0_9SPHI|nr:DUF1835 domain-containing protein [Pedobacter montanisoli]MCJ0741885.1 DUF1835 domain-containing protein [Pedobacter montanisoli]